MATTEYHSVYEALKELSQKIINAEIGDNRIDTLPMNMIMSLSNDEFCLLQLLLWHYVRRTGEPGDGDPRAPQPTAREIWARNERNRDFTMNMIFHVDMSHHFMVTSGQIAVTEPVDCADKHYMTNLAEWEQSCNPLRGTPNGRWNVIYIQWFDRRRPPEQHREHAIICYHEGFDYRRVLTGKQTFNDGSFGGQGIAGRATIGIFDQGAYGRVDKLPPDIVAEAQTKFEETHEIPAPEELWGDILWQTMIRDISPRSNRSPNRNATDEILTLEHGIVVWAPERRGRFLAYFQRNARASEGLYASIPLFFMPNLWSPFPDIIEERN